MAKTEAGLPQHSPAFRRRRFYNWFPLALTYATFYMGRYNFNVVKGDMGAIFHLDKGQMGIIATAGFWTYALSVIINGPLADRMGGRRGMLIGAVGTVLMNLIIGLLFLNGWCTKVLVGMSLLYAANMYFQSFGALSVVKVNASWFHVRERGVLGGWFGSMISLGYFLAISIGGWILAHFQWYMVFLIPSAVIGTMLLVETFLLRDRPSRAGYTDFDVGDASSGDNTPVNWNYLVKNVLLKRVMVILALSEFCTGFVRQGLLLYFVEWMGEVHHITTGTPLFWWGGFAITLGGVAGAITSGRLSDKVFNSRRPPVAFIYYLAQIVCLLLLGLAPNQYSAVFLIGLTCLFVFGVHGMLSGTASMDFGGSKGAATATGLLDGVQYIASGLTGFGLGWVLKVCGWDGVPYLEGYQPVNALVWVGSIIPFSAMGGMLMLLIWNEKPGRKSGH